MLRQHGFGQINRSNLQVHRTTIGVVWGEGNIGKRNRLCFSKNLLARGKDSDILARSASLGFVALCTVNSAPASFDCCKAKLRFANLEELVIDVQS